MEVHDGDPSSCAPAEIHQHHSSYQQARSCDISIFYLLHTPCIRFLIIMMAIQCDYRSNEVTIGHCHLPAHHLQGDVGREGDDVNMLRKCTHATLTIQQSQVGQLWMASSAVLVCLVPTASSVSNLVRQLLQLAATTYKQHTQ